MKVSVFGNPDVKKDNLVVKLVPKLKKIFPKIDFRVEDPSEGLKPPVSAGRGRPERLWVILDVAKGIDKIRVFEDLDKLVTEKRVSLHDYDVSMELKLLKRLGKVEKLKIVAVPMGMDRKKALEKICSILEDI